jgi:hypothetical protein
MDFEIDEYSQVAPEDVIHQNHESFSYKNSSKFIEAGRIDVVKYLHASS